MLRTVVRSLVLPVAALTATACGTSSPPGAGTAGPPAHPAAPVIQVSERGGTPALGPGELYNACERIWCLEHRENYALEHFLEAHVGWIVHDDAHGDVFVPAGRTSGPEFTGARPNALRLCGRHLHPIVLARNVTPIRDRGYRAALGYDRAHFRAYGIRLEPCCLNGLGWAYLHASVARQFRFEDVEIYRGTTSGWQKPFAARAATR